MYCDHSLSPEVVNNGQLLALLPVDEVSRAAAAQAAGVAAEIPLEEEGHPGSAHGHAEDQGTLEDVEYPRDVDQGGDL